MATYYLKATDEAALWQALGDAGLAKKVYDPEDPLNQAPDDAIENIGWEQSGAYEWEMVEGLLNIIGVMRVETGNTLTDPEGNSYPELEEIDGFHANLLAKSGIEGLPTIDPPSTPRYVIFGDKTGIEL